jgi:hypothetical protein
VSQPKGDWTQVKFDDSGWKEGAGGFGTVGPVHSKWTTPDIWIRREFTMPAGEHPNLQFMIFHDEDAQIYINGVLAGRVAGYNSGFEPLEIYPAAKELLKPEAKVTLAVHCHQTIGGQGIDVRLADVK